MPVGELKWQVDQRLARDFKSITVVTGLGVDSSWRYSCGKKQICIHSHCNDGIVGITMKGNSNYFQLELLSICDSESTYTYIVQNKQYKNLIEYGKFAECKTKLVHYEVFETVL